jgi:hypothetical protein
MAIQDSLVLLSLPSASQIACGIRFGGVYHSVAGAILIRKKLGNLEEVKSALEQMDLLLMLSPQESVLRSKFANEFDSMKKHAELTPVLETLNIVCKMDARLPLVSELKSKVVFSDEDNLLLLKQIQEIVSTHLQSQITQYFAPFDEHLGNRCQALSIPWMNTSDLIVSYGDFFEHQIPMTCTWGNEQYRLVDFHPRIPTTPIIQCLLVKALEGTGPDTVVAGVSYFADTGEKIEIKPNSSDLPFETILETIEENYPFPMKETLVARGKLIKRLLSQNGAVSDLATHIAMPS